MAYDQNNLSALAYANGFTLWHYRTQDTFDEVLSLFDDKGYFDAAASMLRVGDLIAMTTGVLDVITMMASDTLRHQLAFVTENQGGRVRVTKIGSAA